MRRQGPSYKVSPSTAVPCKWNKFLKNKEGKQELFEFIVTELHDVVELQGHKVLYMTLI